MRIHSSRGLGIRYDHRRSVPAIQCRLALGEGCRCMGDGQVHCGCASVGRRAQGRSGGGQDCSDKCDGPSPPRDGGNARGQEVTRGGGRCIGSTPAVSHHHSLPLPLLSMDGRPRTRSACLSARISVVDHSPHRLERGSTAAPGRRAAGEVGRVRGSRPPPRCPRPLASMLGAISRRSEPEGPLSRGVRRWNGACRAPRSSPRCRWHHRGQRRPS